MQAIAVAETLRRGTYGYSAGTRTRADDRTARRPRAALVPPRRGMEKASGVIAAASGGGIGPRRRMSPPAARAGKPSRRIMMLPGVVAGCRGALPAPRRGMAKPRRVLTVPAARHRQTGTRTGLAAWWHGDPKARDGGDAARDGHAAARRRRNPAGFAHTGVRFAPATVCLDHAVTRHDRTAARWGQTGAGLAKPERVWTNRRGSSHGSAAAKARPAGRRWRGRDPHRG